MGSLTAPAQVGTVYVVGAGFSMALGYPLVNDLLIRLWEWERFSDSLRARLGKVIRFHHPGFDETRRTSFPNIEQLLTEMMVNEDLFLASRAAPGRFSFDELQGIRKDLLQCMSDWFHSIYDLAKAKAVRPAWLSKFASMLQPEDAIVSFNWDLVLEHLLYGAKLNAASYGFGPIKSELPVILKPHGSLNWFYPDSGRSLKTEKRFSLEPEAGASILVFTRYRRPASKAGREYMPVIIPPILNKNFEEGVQWETWRHTVACLSVAKRVVFLGYSMPEADLHGRFIVQCGFHNQMNGVLANGSRRAPAGAAAVTIVNPDRAAAGRIESAIGPGSRCTWEPMVTQRWIEQWDGY